MTTNRMLAVLVLLSLGPVLAQHAEDEELTDYEEQDRRYYERYVKPSKPEPAPEPLDQRQAYLSKADELIRDKSHRSKNGEHYRVQTDDPRVDLQPALELLESFRSYFERFWDGKTELQPYEGTGRVFLFYSFYKFNQLVVGDWRFRELRPSGHYRPEFDVITMHTDAGDGPAAIADALVHEAAHQLVEQRLFTERYDPALWLSEGLASYFGFTRMDSPTSFATGEVGRKPVSLIKGARPGASGEAAQALKGLRRAWRTEGLAPVGRALWMTDPNLFFGDGAPMHYAASWMLVHYLLHGDTGARAEPFVRYIKAEIRGAGGPELLLKEIGLSEDELEAAVRAHAQRIKLH